MVVIPTGGLTCECAAQPLPYPSQEELWSDLLRRPWLYERSRGQRSSNPPDFKCVRTNAGLWRGSAPEWVRERWGEIDALNVGEKARQGAEGLGVGPVGLRACVQALIACCTCWCEGRGGCGLRIMKWSGNV